MDQKPSTENIDIEIIKWSELYKSGKILGTPTYGMLTSKEITLKMCNRDGDKSITPKQLRNVEYDREFLINQAKHCYRFVLAFASKQEWLDFWSEVYDSNQDKYE